MGTVYIFRTNQRYKEEDLIKEREKLIKQIKDGFVLLNANMEFVSALTELVPNENMVCTPKTTGSSLAIGFSEGFKVEAENTEQ